MVEYLKKKMNTKDGSVKFYYVKVTKNGTQRISKEVYDKNSKNVDGGGPGSYSWRQSDMMTPAQRQNGNYTVSNSSHNNGYYIQIDYGKFIVKKNGMVKDIIFNTFEDAETYINNIKKLANK